MVSQLRLSLGLQVRPWVLVLVLKHWVLNPSLYNTPREVPAVRTPEVRIILLCKLYTTGGCKEQPRGPQPPGRLLPPFWPPSDNCVISYSWHNAVAKRRVQWIFFWCTLRILYAFRQNVSVSQTPTGALPLDPLGDYDNYVVFQRPQCYLIAATAFETSSKLLRWLLMIFSGTTSTSTHRISICDRTTHTSK